MLPADGLCACGGPAVDGLVTDNNGEPLFGAVAAHKGKTAATTTGVRGEYALQGVDLRRDTLVLPT